LGGWKNRLQIHATANGINGKTIATPEKMTIKKYGSGVMRGGSDYHSRLLTESPRSRQRILIPLPGKRRDVLPCLKIGAPLFFIADDRRAC
jgi:hypothetical protein